MAGLRDAEWSSDGQCPAVLVQTEAARIVDEHLYQVLVVAVRPPFPPTYVVDEFARGQVKGVAV
jgi:hypothetical protein